jgi:hypothetical protein
MSYFDYLACNRELPTGHFGLPPKAIYNSYMAYRDSKDFTVPRNFLTGELADLNSEGMKKLERLKGKIVVYETARDARLLILEPYTPIVTHRGDEVFEPSRKVMAKHFTLPHLYNLYVSSKETLIEYLCKYLQPGDQAEVYTCWAGEETLKRKDIGEVVDLDEVEWEGNVPNCKRLSDNPFKRYLAPSKPNLNSQIGPVKRIDYAVHVLKEQESVLVALHKAQEQGL